MSINKEREKIYKELYDISSIDEPVNLETIDGIPPTRKLNALYFNLLWKVDFKLPEIDGIKSLIILLEFFYNKFSDIRKISPNLISRKFDIYCLLIKQLLNIKKEQLDKSGLKSLEQYFFDKDFFSCFLKLLNHLKNTIFFEKFTVFSKVSPQYIYNNYLIDNSKSFRRKFRFKQHIQKKSNK